MRRSLTGILSIAVTGTKGKTSTTEYVGRLVEASGLVTAISTGEFTQIADRTSTYCDTGLDVARFVRRSGRAAVDCVVVELYNAMLRWNFQRGFELDAAVLTNIGTDHIDYHGNTRNYVAVKQRLFRGLRSTPNSPSPVAVLNADDRYVAEFRRCLAKGVMPCYYGLRRPARSGGVMVWASDIKHRRDGTSFLIHGLGHRPRGCRTALHGDFNVSNVVAAIACVAMLGGDPETLVAAASTLTPPPGRFDILQPPTAAAPGVVVDYAHTPESLAAALAAARRLSPGGRLHAVFGCGGDTYKAKRPLMGAAAAGVADAITLTADNPRSEDPHAIARAILRGVPPPNRGIVRIELDRARAIDEAIAGASSGDVVAILGKGAERTQEISGRTQAFSDLAVARAALARHADRRRSANRK